ncbi:MAG: CBS domain-containing protein [Candidatus Omnitrophica bacterium]|jgi:CBS domain-containing protein|nr:CBS domain-containing protein [Candidatus Omnitrophota bacterium]
MKVKEVMNRVITSVKPEDNALDALKLLFKMEISGLPVIDSDGRLAGMFTEKEILAFMLPSYLEQVGKFVYAQDPKASKKKIHELKNMKVAQLMRKQVVVGKEDMTLIELAKDMLTQKARRIPIIDQDEKVQGIVARCDILKALVKDAEIPLEC